ncbi:MAG: DUF4136 domain-containing protein [Sandarakinorhabdus sp.]|nr:DUF4136 domain-containing protein [Sandarakinorhabdus sp.]
MGRATPAASVLAAALALSACSPGAHADVVRFHTSEPVSRGTIAIQPADPALADSIAFAAQADAVSRELQRLGFTVAGNPAHARLVAIISVETADRLHAPRRSGVSIGVGGGFSSGNVGFGTSVNVPVGGRQQADFATTTTLSVAITEGTGGPAVWEGRSSLETQAPGKSGTALTPYLADTLFRGFPGPAGQTVRVPIR